MIKDGISTKTPTKHIGIGSGQFVLTHSSPEARKAIAADCAQYERTVARNRNNRANVGLPTTAFHRN